MFKSLSFYRHIFIAAMIGTVIIVGMCVAIMKTEKPYAVASGGSKVTEAWSVYAGDKEIAVVGSKEDARFVVHGIKTAYTDDKDRISNLKTTPALSYEQKDLKKEGKNITVLDNRNNAVSNVINANMADPSNPAVTVSYTMDSRKTGPIPYKTISKETDKISKGEQYILRNGKNGYGTAVIRTTYKNGKPAVRRIAKLDVKTPAVSKLVYVGAGTARYEIAASTNGRGIKTVTDMADSVSPTTKSGEAVANFACQFIGNSYSYGGTSLTNGTDCSGFVMSVYRRFGIALPHSSGSQAHYGKPVSYSKARPGDVFCYSGHVAIYIGRGKIVHAATPSQGIIVGSATYHKIKSIRRLIK